MASFCQPENWICPRTIHCLRVWKVSVEHHVGLVSVHHSLFAKRVADGETCEHLAMVLVWPASAISNL